MLGFRVEVLGIRVMALDQMPLAYLELSVNEGLQIELP